MGKQQTLEPTLTPTIPPRNHLQQTDTRLTNPQTSALIHETTTPIPIKPIQLKKTQLFTRGLQITSLRRLAGSRVELGAPEESKQLSTAAGTSWAGGRWRKTEESSRGDGGRGMGRWRRWAWEMEAAADD
ncbi:hypothetical protein E2562_004900 [Oryza meyeriana var. granulata]|uniref:Uncharacterized protein n=1 Tax=Oryza meyeriana var. granulata TaxID=110450 RepID=A0A6G1C3T9_9ORYZ|nr:hypothetical protein E2562_004900 [Oryza meyeriana var. granulata]